MRLLTPATSRSDCFEAGIQCAMVVTSKVTGSSVSAASGLDTSAPAADSATSAAPFVKLASRTHLTLVESVVAMVTRSSTVSGGRSGSGRMPGR